MHLLSQHTKGLQSGFDLHAEEYINVIQLDETCAQLVGEHGIEGIDPEGWVSERPLLFNVDEASGVTICVSTTHRAGCAHHHSVG